MFQVPLFIVGFHHSGTRLLAKILASSGVFQVGTGQTFEWNYIQEINSSIYPKWYDSSGFDVDHIEKNANKIRSDEIYSKLVEKGYQGGLWAHKDPRTCVTLPAWIKQFPNASVIHLVRNPLDVIGTLPEAYQEFSPQHLPPQKEIGFWIDLWTKTMDHTTRYLQSIKVQKFIEIRYEDICLDPKNTLELITQKLEVNLSNNIDIEKINPSIDNYKVWMQDGRLNENDVQLMKEVAANHLGNYNYS